MAIMHVLTYPVLSLQLGMLRSGMVSNGVRVVSTGTGKLNTDVCLCGSAHTSGCVVDSLGAVAAAYCYYDAGKNKIMYCTRTTQERGTVSPGQKVGVVKFYNLHSDSTLPIPSCSTKLMKALKCGTLSESLASQWLC